VSTTWTRRVWTTLGSVLTVVVLASVLLQVLGVLGRSSVRVDRELSADGIEALVVDVTEGSVEIRGTDSTRIRVTGSVHSGLATTEHTERTEGTRFVVRARCPGITAANFCSVDHVIDVPRGLHVVVRSRNTSVVLSDLSGSVDVTTSDASVEADRLSGPLTIRTSNDSIDARDMRSTSNRFETSNGRVRAEFVVEPETVQVSTSEDSVAIVVPDTPATYAVGLDTSNDEQITSVRTDPSSPRRIDVDTSNGGIVVRYPRD